MRVLVCGGRNFTDKEFLFSNLSRLHNTLIITAIIEGGATGADRLANIWAIDNNIQCMTVKAEWDKYGKSAGYKRNEKMLKEGRPDLVVAFHGGVGTANMVSIANKGNVKVLDLRN